MESVAALNTVVLPYSTFYLGFSQIETYLRKYETRLSPKNAKFLRDISAICADFCKYLKLKWQANREAISFEQPVDVIEILAELDLYRIDFAKLTEFFEKADLTRKVGGFIQAQT